jgi:hypothetical protein
MDHKIQGLPQAKDFTCGEVVNNLKMKRRCRSQMPEVMCVWDALGQLAGFPKRSTPHMMLAGLVAAMDD